jgi:hypothetical protein
MYASVNEILDRHGSSEDKLTVRTVTYENDDPSLDASTQTFVLLEGNENALKFLAEMILAHLATPICDVSLHPLGAGSAHFSSTSTTGIILHKLPCADGHY